MNSTLPYKTKQFFFILIKLGIVVGAFYFICSKLLNNGTLDFHDFIDFLNESSIHSTKNILILLLLSFFNWFFEIAKWRVLVSSIKKITPMDATEQSLGSLTASLFTPNRIGEYGAKAIYFHKSQRKRVLLLNLIGNMMQMGITVILGIIGLWTFANAHPIEVDFLKISRGIVVFFVVLSMIFIGLKKTRFTIKGVSFDKIKRFVFDLSTRIKFLAFAFSLIRYAIFSFQFYFLLQIFGVGLSYLEAISIITSMYLLASAIPSFFIFDVIVKGSVAVYLFSMVGVNELTILCIITLMWLFNFVLPSIFGSYYVLNFNLPIDD